MTARKPSLRVTRDTLLLVAGLAGLAYETLIGGAERPTLIIAFLALCGFPVFLRTDERQSTEATKAEQKKEAPP